jgi:hypothetical protein
MSKSIAAVLALSLLLPTGIGVRSSAAGQNDSPCGPTKGAQGCNQKQRMERWRIMNDQQTKTVAPKGGSTGPTAPPKPTQGNARK